jgi:hypothetical protein
LPNVKRVTALSNPKLPPLFSPQVFFEASYTATTFTGGWTVDAFACYDVLYTLQDGVLTAQF